MTSTQTIALEIETMLARVPGESFMGIGIDVETSRAVNPESARFFLSEAERESLKEAGADTSARTLLRLWTVKEAIMKADPKNDGRMLGDYMIEDPLQWRGVAYARDRAPLRFHYSSVPMEQGFLSIAVVVKGEPNA
jgi:phosphopantetheinyl transferase (holo-ACP synthase)